MRPAGAEAVTPAADEPFPPPQGVTRMVQRATSADDFMRKVVFFGLMLLATPAAAQTTLGVRGGIGFSTVSMPEGYDTETRTVAIVGLDVGIQLSDAFSLRVGGSYAPIEADGEIGPGHGKSTRSPCGWTTSSSPRWDGGLRRRGMAGRLASCSVRGPHFKRSCNAETGWVPLESPASVSGRYTTAPAARACPYRLRPSGTSAWART